MENFRLVGSKKVREVLNTYKDYTLYIRKGFAFNGASEVLDDKETKLSQCIGGPKIMTFDERMQQVYESYVTFDINIDNEKKELHLNAFSVNDMY